MAEERENNDHTVINIAADGDIILIVGPERLKLRVQSLVLKAVSKPFSAMLGPEWKGDCQEQHTTDGPMELVLPEDDEVGMKYLCVVMHHQNKMIPEALTVHDILRVAVMADKYDFVEAFVFTSAAWLVPGNKEANELMVLAAAALLFQNAQAFKAVTKALILDYDSSYLALVDQDLESVMSWRVFYMLEEQRSFARLRLAEILIKGFNSGACCHPCGWSSKYAYAYLESLERANLWPTGIHCISKVIKQAENMPQSIPTEPSIACKYERKHTLPEYTRYRRWDVDNLTDHIGLCLHCVRSGRISSTYCGKTHE